MTTGLEPPSTRPVSLAVVGLRFGAHILGELLNGAENARPVRPAFLCDRDARLLGLQRERSGLSGSCSFEETLARDDIDAVALYTPPRGRAELIGQAIRAGKHVMTTKPFERDSRAARAVLEEARALGRVVHLNSPAPFASPPTQRILAWRREHDLGRPVLAQWTTWGDYHEQADGSWMDSPRECPVAPIYRLGVYGINELIRFFGPVEEVRVVESRVRTGRPTADNGLVTLRHAGGTLTSVMASFCVADAPAYRNDLTVHFERGTVTRQTLVDDGGRARLRLRLSGSASACEWFPAEVNDGHYQWDVFHRAIRSPAAAADDEYHRLIVEGVRVLEALHPEARSTGQP